ncbi:MAG: hypothetical protein V5A27_02690 [Halapricum sp.]
MRFRRSGHPDAVQRIGRNAFDALHQEYLEGMPAILEDEFRRRADVDEHESSA